MRVFNTEGRVVVVVTFVLEESSVDQVINTTTRPDRFRALGTTEGPRRKGSASVCRVTPYLGDLGGDQLGLRGMGRRRSRRRFGSSGGALLGGSGRCGGVGRHR